MNVKYKLMGGLGNQLFIYARYLRDVLDGKDAGYYFSFEGREFSLKTISASGGNTSLPDSSEGCYFQSQYDVDRIPVEMIKLFDYPLEGAALVLKEKVEGKQVCFIRNFESTHCPALYCDLGPYLKDECYFITDDKAYAESILPEGYHSNILDTDNIDPLDILVAASFASEIVRTIHSTFGWWANWVKLIRSGYRGLISTPATYTDIPDVYSYKIMHGKSATLDVVEPVKGFSHELGCGAAHVRALSKALDKDIFPCVVYEEDASVTDAHYFFMPDDDIVFLGYSRIGHSSFPLMSYASTVRGAFNLQGRFCTHGILYNTREGCQKMLDIYIRSLGSCKPIDWYAQDVAFSEGFSFSSVLLPWVYQFGPVSGYTKHSVFRNGGDIVLLWQNRSITFEDLTRDKEYGFEGLSFNNTHPELKGAVSFSLFGQNTKHLLGVYENILYSRKYYPGYDIVIHIEEDHPYVETLRNYEDVIVVTHPKSRGTEGMFWRFETCDVSSGYDVVCVRDIDSRMTKRELVAHREWLDSGKALHVMFDYGLTSSVFVPGGCFSVRPEQVDIDFLSHPSGEVVYSDDEYWLSDVLKEYYNNDSLIHSSVNCRKGVPFKHPQEHNRHIGFIVHGRN